MSDDTSHRGHVILLPPVSRQPDHAVIDLLRDILARAERGEVASFAGVAVLRDGSTLEAWTMRRRVPLLLGAMSMLTHRMAASTWDDSGA